MTGTVAGAPVVAARSARYPLGDRSVARLGFGGMKLSGRRLMGSSTERGTAVAVLRRAVELGVQHLETSAHYGPDVVNALVREALRPYPEELVVVTKVGARRTPDGGWVPALGAAELRRAVHDDLDSLGVDVLDVVLLRMPGLGEQMTGDIVEPFGALAQLQQEGLVRHLGLSHVTAEQVAATRAVAPLACVQNHYNIVHRDDDAQVDALAREGIPYVAMEGLSYTTFFPVRDLAPRQEAALDAVARRLDATRSQVAMAWILARSPNLLVIPGATSVAQLEENVAAAALALGPADLAELDRIADDGTPGPRPAGSPTV